MEGDSISLTAIIGIVGAALTVLIKLFDAVNSWKKSRDTAMESRREITQTKDEVELIGAWLNAIGNTVDGEALASRKQLALKRLDKLMATSWSIPETDKKAVEPKTKPRGNVGLYAMSIFLSFAILGLFVDDNDNWSLSYFQQNLDSDTLLGFAFFMIFWVYFLVNSKFFRGKS